MWFLTHSSSCVRAQLAQLHIQELVLLNLLDVDVVNEALRDTGELYSHIDRYVHTHVIARETTIHRSMQAAHQRTRHHVLM